MSMDGLSYSAKKPKLCRRNLFATLLRADKEKSGRNTTRSVEGQEDGTLRY
jgi:hypothetical protein